MKKKNKNILILAPHPDDEVVGTCTIIKKGMELGQHFYIFFLTNGVIPREEMWFFEKKKYSIKLDIRLTEMKKAVKYLGIKKYYLQNIPSRSLKMHIVKTINKIKLIVQTHNITTIFTPAYEGGHQDHDVSNFIASKFIKQLNVYEFAEYNNFGGKSVSNTFIGEDTNEEILILNDKEISYKKKMLNIYKSETKNLGHIKVVRETLRKLKSYDYSQRPHKGKLFYERFNLFSWHPRVDGTSPEIVCEILKNTRFNNVFKTN